MASFGIRKGLEDISYELKGIRNILASMWHSRYQNGETNLLNPEAFADEYISTDECSRRLGVSDQTIRNWMATGRKNADKGWLEGVHYINVCPDDSKRAVIRIPWNHLVRSFSKDRPTVDSDFHKMKPLYQSTTEGKL